MMIPPLPPPEPEPPPEPGGSAGELPPPPPPQADMNDTNTNAIRECFMGARLSSFARYVYPTTGHAIPGVRIRMV